MVESAKAAGSGGIAHFYAARKQTIAALGPGKRWFSRGHTIAISPVAEPGITVVPEAVEDQWWSAGAPAGDRRRGGDTPLSAGVFVRAGLRNIIDQTIHRVHRTRDDIEFLVYDGPPDDFSEVDVWFDPALDERDFDGCVAEALVSGLPVVASRTKINAQRLEQGRTGFLVPLNDPNELTHAILSALFKPEVARQKTDAARQTIGKFRPRQRLRALTAIYESLHP